MKNKVYIILLALFCPLATFALHIDQEDWDDKAPTSGAFFDFIGYVFGALLVLFILLLIVGFIISSINDFFTQLREPPAIKEKKKSLKKDIKEQKIYVFKNNVCLNREDAFGGTMYYSIEKGEKCRIVYVDSKLDEVFVYLIDKGKCKDPLKTKLSCIEKE